MATKKKKRASMREGPLADLFRSTDESVAEEDVTVTATRETTKTEQVEVATAEPATEPKVIRDAGVQAN